MTSSTVQGWFATAAGWLSPIARWCSPAFEKLNPDGASSAPDRRVVGLNVALLGTLAVLFGTGGWGLPRPVVMVALGAYAVIAFFWVRAQYQESLADTPTVPTWRTVIRVCAVGVALVLYGVVVGPQEQEGAEPLNRWEELALVRGPGVLLLVGVIALYWGFGFVIVRTRAGIAQALDSAPDAGVAAPSGLHRAERLLLWMGTPQRVPVPVIAIGIMLILVAAGLGLLGSLPVAPILVALGLLAFPFALSLLSETAIRWCEGTTRDRRWVVFLVGLLLATIGTLVSWALGETPLPVFVMLGLALLIVAIASATLVDVAVVLAAVALLGVTVSPDDPLPEVTDPTGVIVSLGDSYMSGEGADRYLEGTDEGGGNECRRARTAWPVLASEELGKKLLFLACSGADSWNIRYGEDRRTDQEPLPEPQYLPGLTQLAEYRVRFEGKGAPSLVVLSIGGNDAGFASIGLTCLAPGDCNDDQPSKLWSDGNLDRVENRLRQVYSQIRKTFVSSPVVVAPYPDPLAAAAPCSSADLSTGDVVFIRKFLASLNERIRVVAADYGFYYAAPMVDALRDENLQLCGSSSAGPGINFIGIRSVGGFLEHRLNPTKWNHNSLHPNARGHAAMNAAFQRWLRAQVDGPDTGLAALRPASARSAGTGPAPVSEVSVRDGQEPAAEGCAAYPIDDARGCKALSTTWALQETGVFLLARGVWALFVVLGAWLIAVAFFGWRRAAT